MLSYFLKKLPFFVATLLVVMSVTFFLLRAIPGDPFTQDLPMNEEVMQAVRHHYHFDKPLYWQYGFYLKNLVCGELGPSLKYEGQSVQSIIRDGFPISCLLGCEAFLIALSGGLSLGTLAALKRGGWLDRTLLAYSILGLSLPSFILALLLQYLLAVKWHWFPIARADGFVHTLLPALSLSVLPLCAIFRFVRTNVLQVLEQDYVAAAEARGVPFPRLLFYHILPGVIPQLLTYTAPVAVHLMLGSFVVEKVYALPGLGKWFVSSVLDHDYSVTLGLTFFYTVLLLGLVLAAEFLHALIDPRIRRG